jgi:hypothetical protein
MKIINNQNVQVTPVNSDIKGVVMDYKERADKRRSQESTAESEVV